MRETFDSSLRAGRYVLENMGFSEYEASSLSKAYFRLDRSAMRDLAELWVPGQRVDLNLPMSSAPNNWTATWKPP